MEMTWDLSVLYSGYDDPKYSSDYEKLLQLISLAKEEKLDSENPILTIEFHLKADIQMSSVISELFSYSSLRCATNVNDYEALAQMGKIRLALQETVEADVLFTKFLKDLDLDMLLTMKACEHCVNYYEIDIETLNNMLQEFRYYIFKGHFIDTIFKNEIRSFSDC